jgi:hypothetical protein
LLDKGNQKDYFTVESVLKGNYLIKTNWRKEMHDYYNGGIKSRGTPAQSLHLSKFGAQDQHPE